MDEVYDTDAPISNGNLGRLLATEMITDVAYHDSHGEEYSNNEIDSHENIPVVGKHAYVLSCTGRTIYVNPYMPDY